MRCSQKIGKILKNYLRGSSFLLHLQAASLKFYKYFSRVLQTYIQSSFTWNSKQSSNLIRRSFWIFLSSQINHSSPFFVFKFQEHLFSRNTSKWMFSLCISECYIQKIIYECKNVISTCYRLTFSSVPSSNEFALFLLEKECVLIYQVVVSCSFLNQRQLDDYLNHSSTLPFLVSVTVTQKPSY